MKNRMSREHHWLGSHVKSDERSISAVSDGGSAYFRCWLPSQEDLLVAKDTVAT